MAAIPPNEKIILLSALSILSAVLNQLAIKYNDEPHHKIHDLLENFNAGLGGFTASIAQL